MSVNFYNEAGIMFGVDMHVLPELGYVPTIASVGFSHWAHLWPKKIETVTMDGACSIQTGFDLYLIAHAPCSAIVFLNSGSKAFMNVHKVRLAGDKAAVCTDGCMGTNANCNDPLDMPGSTVINVNSVKTEPTLGDCVGSLCGLFVDAVMGWGAGKVSKRFADKVDAMGDGWTNAVETFLKHLYRRTPEISDQFIPDDPRFREVTDLQTKTADKLNQFVQEAIDG